MGAAGARSLAGGGARCGGPAGPLSGVSLLLKVSDPFCGGSAKGLTLFLWRAFFPRGGAGAGRLAGGGARCGGPAGAVGPVRTFFSGECNCDN